jgi:hypothetical protein
MCHLMVITTKVYSSIMTIIQPNNMIILYGPSSLVEPCTKVKQKNMTISLFEWSQQLLKLYLDNNTGAPKLISYAVTNFLVPLCPRAPQWTVCFKRSYP